MFEVGDIVMCNTRNIYRVTDVGVKCIVKEVHGGRLSISTINGDEIYRVDAKYFNVVEKVIKKEEKGEENMERREEIKEALNLEEMMQNGYNILNSCEIYTPRAEGMNKIERVWLESKLYTPIWDNMSLFEILSKHPNYVPEKGYIAFSNDWNRPVDIKVIREVIGDIHYNSDYILEPIKVGIYTYRELVEILNHLQKKLDMANDLMYQDKNLVKKDNLELLEEEVRRINKKINEFDGEFRNGQCYTPKSVHNRSVMRYLLNAIDAYVSRDKENFDKEIVIDEIVYNEIAKYPEIKGVRVGQKLNKVIGKILKTYGLDKNDKYNSWLARLGDACSPIQFTRHTIISLNRNDYWTMSFGDHWCSCANIDKNHMRESSDEGLYGDGCCSSGTESYMLDPSTVVMYTVDASYTGRDFELQDKINRCLFHVGDRKFVMGRVYPQGTDGEDAVYKQWRETFQKVIADCLGVTNFWKTLAEDKRSQYYSYGTHYQDYEQDYCYVAKWSYLKENQDDTYSKERIIIGHDPICPCCGEEHDNQENIQCCGYGHRCADCGDWYEEDDMYLIDGEWYCSDCVEYCDYHGQYEHEELTHVNGYGYVCDYALDYSGNFARCSHCDEWLWVDHDDTIYIDGNHFCNESCAENDGYHYCNECSEWVSSEDWNEEEGMCDACVEESEGGVE